MLTLSIEGLDIEGLTLSVFDVQGHSIESRQVNNNTENIDLCKKLSGVYFIRIEGAELNCVQRVMKL